MISTKSDIMTFLTTHDLSHSLPEDNIGIHKKFLKIVKCFKLLGKKRELILIYQEHHLNQFLEDQLGLKSYHIFWLKMQ